MGLDAKIMIEVLYGPQYDTPRWECPDEGGFPAVKTQLLVVQLFKHHYIHGFMCERNDEAHECKAIIVEDNTLLALETKLKKWATDPEAFRPCLERWWGPFFGFRPGEDGFEQQRDDYRKQATRIAKQIRKARQYIKKMNAKNGFDIHKPMYYAVYEASW